MFQLSKMPQYIQNLQFISFFNTINIIPTIENGVEILYSGVLVFFRFFLLSTQNQKTQTNSGLGGVIYHLEAQSVVIRTSFSYFE